MKSRRFSRIKQEAAFLSGLGSEATKQELSDKNQARGAIVLSNILAMPRIFSGLYLVGYLSAVLQDIGPNQTPFLHIPETRLF